MPQASRPTMKQTFLAAQWWPAVGGVEGERGCFKAPVLVATAAGAASTRGAGGVDRGGTGLAIARGMLDLEAGAWDTWRLSCATRCILTKEGGGCRHFFERQQALNVNTWWLQMRDVAILPSGSLKAITRDKLECGSKRWGGRTQEGICVTFSEWKMGLLVRISCMQAAGE